MLSLPKLKRGVSTSVATAKTGGVMLNRVQALCLIGIAGTLIALHFSLQEPPPASSSDGVGAALSPSTVRPLSSPHVDPIQVDGLIQHRREGTEWRLLRPAEVLESGDKLRTIDDVRLGHASLTLADGSVIDLAPGTVIKLETFASQGQQLDLAVVRGTADFFIAKRSPGATTQVSAPHGKLTVKGTVFRVGVDDNTTEVDTAEGLVLAYPAQSQAPIEVPAGSGIDFLASTELPFQRPADDVIRLNLVQSALTRNLRVVKDAAQISKSEQKAVVASMQELVGIALSNDYELLKKRVVPGYSAEQVLDSDWSTFQFLSSSYNIRYSIEDVKTSSFAGIVRLSASVSLSFAAKDSHVDSRDSVFHRVSSTWEQHNGIWKIRSLRRE